MGKYFLKLAIAACIALGAVPAQADVIYDNGYGDELAWFSGYSATVLDDFVLQAGASTITDFHWYGAYLDDSAPASDDFTLYIFDENFNLIETIDGSTTTRIATGNEIGFDVLDEYYYELFVDPIVLNPGETYYLGIANEDDHVWLWESASLFSGDAAVWYQDIDKFVDGTGNFAFQLTGPGGVVPEPASLTLIGLGIAGMAIRRKYFGSH